MQRNFSNAFLYLSLLVLCLFLQACSTVSRPDNVSNACHIFSQYPSWYRATKHTERKWGVSPAVQLAIVRQESDFCAEARPPRRKVLGFLPGKRPTTAYGYCQAVNGTWKIYQNDTNNYDAERNDFTDASDFIGWYCHRAHQRVGIALNDAYNLYLAYHEGITNYMHRTFARKPWLLRVSKRVQLHAYLYQHQLEGCGKG